jgi:hypothetical protein
MGHIHRRLELGETQCFQQDADGVLWFRDYLVVPKDSELHQKIMDVRLIALGILPIQEPARCIKI